MSKPAADGTIALSGECRPIAPAVKICVSPTYE